MDLMLSSTDIRLKIPGEEASSICTPSALAIFLIDMVDPMPQEKNTTTFPPGLSPRKPSEFSLPNPPQQASVNSIGWLAKTVGEMWPVTRVSMSFHEFPISHRVYTYHKFSLAHTHTFVATDIQVGQRIGTQQPPPLAGRRSRPFTRRPSRIAARSADRPCFELPIPSSKIQPHQRKKLEAHGIKEKLEKNFKKTCATNCTWLIQELTNLERNWAMNGLYINMSYIYVYIATLVPYMT